MERFATYYARRFGKRIDSIPLETMEALTRYSWPGNIRELQNCIERAVILCDGRVVKPEHLGVSLRIPFTSEEPSLTDGLQAVSSAASRAAETKLIERVLAETGGNKSRAAEILQVSYKTLLTKIKDYGLDRT